MKALAEQYHCLPSDVLMRSPAMLYLDLLMTFPPEAAATPPKQDAARPSMTELLTALKAGANGHGRE